MDKKEVTRIRKLEFFGLAGSAGLTECLSGGNPDQAAASPIQLAATGLRQKEFKGMRISGVEVIQNEMLMRNFRLY